MFSRWRRWRERTRQPRWHPETFVCSRRGHVVPAAEVAVLRREDAGLGLDLADGRRLVRCLRCDSWREVARPDRPARPTLPPLAAIRLPRRGEALREAIVLRVIAIDRMVHVVLFGLLFAVALSFELHLGPLREQARKILDALQTTAANSPAASQGFIARELTKLVNVHSGTLVILIVTSLVYCLLELIEAIGLWHERRWAEYLTAIATAGFLPFEIIELSRRVTVIRIAALVVNLLILGWLLYRKRLFGIAGGGRTLGHERLDPTVLLAAPPSQSEPALDG